MCQQPLPPLTFHPGHRPLGLPLSGLHLSFKQLLRSLLQEVFLGSLEAGEEIVSIPGDVEMYKSPGFLGHAAVFGFPLSLGSPPWGAHGGPSLLGLVSVFLVPLLEGSTEGLQSPAQLACSWVHWEGAVMMSCGLQPPAWQLVGGSVLAQGPVPHGGPGTGHRSHRGIPCPAARLPFPVGIRVYPGAQGEWAGVDLSGAPPLSGRPDPSASAEAGLLP